MKTKHKITTQKFMKNRPQTLIPAMWFYSYVQTTVYSSYKYN